MLEAGLIEDLRISSDFLLRDINGHLSISNAINFALNNPVLAVKVNVVSKVPIPFSITAESLLALPEIPKLPEPTLSVKVTDPKFLEVYKKRFEASTKSPLLMIGVIAFGVGSLCLAKKPEEVQTSLVVKSFTQEIFEALASIPGPFGSS